MLNISQDNVENPHFLYYFCIYEILRSLGQGRFLSRMLNFSAKIQPQYIDNLRIQTIDPLAHYAVHRLECGDGFKKRIRIVCYFVWLAKRLKQKKYKAKLVRSHYIPKEKGYLKCGSKHSSHLVKLR